MEQLRQILNAVADPEIPVLTLNDLGMIRNLEFKNNRYVLTITPTYSGCPAVDRMKDDLIAQARTAGVENIEIQVSYSPAWSTDWMTETGRERLKEYGIAPPAYSCSSPTCVTDIRAVQCPRCNSEDTKLISAFGSTACKSLHQCNSCLEPFEHFKQH